jgi:hypothetical protein
VTRAPLGMQNMSKIIYGQNEHLAYLARANKAPGGLNRSPAWPSGIPRQFDFSAGRVGAWFWGAWLHRRCHRRGIETSLFRLVISPAAPWASSSEPEAHAGIAFYAPDFGYNKRQAVKSRLLSPGARTFTQETHECAFTCCSGSRHFALDTCTALLSSQRGRSTLMG